jgi:hypothetical protein
MLDYLNRNTVDIHINRLPPKLKEATSNAKIYTPPTNRIR